MRLIFVLAGCLMVLSSQAQVRSFFNMTTYCAVDGKVRNYKPRANNRFLTIRSYDVTGRKKDTAVQIKPDGSYFLWYIVPIANNIDIGYSGTFVKIVARSDGRNQFDIDDKLWVSAEHKSKAIIPLDEMSRHTVAKLEYDYHFKKRKFNTQVDWTDSSYSDDALVELRLQRMKEELAYTDSFFRARPVSYYIERLMQTNIRFEAADDIVYSLFTFSRKRTYSHDKLFALVKHFPVDSMLSALSTPFYKFAYHLAGALQISYLNDPAFEDLHRQSPLYQFPYILDKIDSTDHTRSTGIWYKLLYYNLYIANSPAKTGFYEARFYSKVNDQLLRNNMDAWRATYNKPFTEYSLLDKLKAADVDAALKQRLIGLFESHKEKYVYMDFWGNWCEPCMQEMPHYPEFIGRLKNKNIVFLFMGVNTPEEKALQVKEKYKIEGEFITLDASEVSILKNLLAIGGYPAHLLLKPGAIVSGYPGENITWGKSFNPTSVKKLETFLAATQ